MSVHVSSAVWRDSRADGGAFVVILALADQANDDGWCWPSVASLARRARVSPRSVHRHLNELEKLGEVKREDRPGDTTMYRVRVGQSDSAANLTPLTVVTGGSANSGRGGLPPMADKTSLNHQEPSSSSSEIASDPDPDDEKTSDKSSELDKNPRPEVLELCEHLARRVRENGHDVKTIGIAWWRPARLLLDRDGRTAEQVHKAIEWATGDGFWSTNIRSMQTLREKYTVLQAQAKTRGQSQRPLQAVPSYEPPRRESIDPDEYDRRAGISQQEAQ